MTKEETLIAALRRENLELKIKAQNCLADLKNVVLEQGLRIMELEEGNRVLLRECVVLEDLYVANALGS